MMHLRFALPLGLWLGLPLLVALLAAYYVRQQAQLADPQRRLILVLLRGTALLALVLLLGRPMLVESEEANPVERGVVLLVDRSESMSLEEQGSRRYDRAIQFARDRLLPALDRAGLRTSAMLFAESATASSGTDLARAEPDGKSTNLARAVLDSLSLAEAPPLALIVLTDGAANLHGEQRRALAALVERRTPLIGVGIGADTGPRTLRIQRVDAPPRVPPKQEFAVTAYLESGGEGPIALGELLLMRDGQLAQRKTIAFGAAGRVWVEGFTVREEDEGTHQYTVELLPPQDATLRCLERTASTAVRVVAEKELRILFVQSALTWDYKFIRLALSGDPAIRLTGLSRTSSSSVFYQNVENAEELKGGFPQRLDDLARFSVVVLSSIRHADLTPTQQELLTRYVGEYGGGLLMIGGPETFDGSWRESTLERLLAVRFATSSPSMSEEPFQLGLTEDALRHPVFRIDESTDPRAAWSRVPAFLNYAVVEDAKPGAQIWATHPRANGAHGPRVLMASQRFGAGTSAVIGVQNFWRWRLAKESDPRQFDRFWQQMVRYLADSGRNRVTLALPDQELAPGKEIRVQIVRQPDPQQSSNDGPMEFHVTVQNDQRQDVSRQSVSVGPGGSAEFSFLAASAGSYTLTIEDAQKQPVVSRTIDVREPNLEFQHAARDMDRLRQWAAASDGLARKLEECADADELVDKIRDQASEARRRAPRREPQGISGWVLLLIAGCLSGEWLLRRRWRLA